MRESIVGTKTEKNIAIAIMGESYASNRYTWFAKQAKSEGYEIISAYFLETAEQERAHAKRFFRLLEGGSVEVSTNFAIGTLSDTVSNLKDSITGELNEYTSLYPEFARVAVEEGFSKVAAAFKVIANAEETHARHFQKMLESLENGTLFERDEPVNWLCRKCGYVHKGKKAPQNCPACNHPQAYFEEEILNY